jgi:DNA-binding SARP family transcriptional activator
MKLNHFGAATSKDEVVEFKVLGPLEAVRNDVPVALGGSKQRALLALLLIHANEAVSIDRLIDDLWGARPPQAARASLQNLVSQLRKVLGSDLLQTKGPGYALILEWEQLDSGRFEHLVTRAQGEGGEERLRTLNDALGLWRGVPLSDVFYESFAQSEIRRLEELRVTALEDRCAAKLEVGATSEVVPELQALVASYPYRERLRRQLMLALYRSGRGVDALRTYVDWRAKLRKEWQTEPGAAIEQTAKHIRDRRPELDEVLLWSKLGDRRLHRARLDTADPLAKLKINEALPVFQAVDDAANGLPDRLGELEVANVASIVDAVLRHWVVGSVG